MKPCLALAQVFSSGFCGGGLGAQTRVDRHSPSALSAAHCRSASCCPYSRSDPAEAHGLKCAVKPRRIFPVIRTEFRGFPLEPIRGFWSFRPKPVALAATHTVARAAGLARLRDFAGAALDEHGLWLADAFSAEDLFAVLVQGVPAQLDLKLIHLGGPFGVRFSPYAQMRFLKEAVAPKRAVAGADAVVLLKISHVSATLSSLHRTSVTAGFGAGFGASAENSACSFARFSLRTRSPPRRGTDATKKPAVDPPRATRPSRNRRPPAPHEQGWCQATRVRATALTASLLKNGGTVRPTNAKALSRPEAASAPEATMIASSISPIVAASGKLN